MMRYRVLVLILLLWWMGQASPTKAVMPNDPPSPQSAPAVQSAAALPWCSIQPEHGELLERTNISEWTGWIARLSGESAMTLEGKPIYITTRNSYALFDGRSPAYEALREQVLSWYPASQIEEDPFTTLNPPWKNLILTIPGTLHPEEVVLLTAHFDDMPGSGPAPGADDNASGSASLLEAARILRDSPLPRTVRLIWFTGEEQGLVGSRAYTADHDLSNVIGVINLDMFAYDGDNDRCFELHVGSLPASNMIGQCIVRAIDDYDLNLTFDFLTSSYTSSSDHASFWSKGIGAVEVLENYFVNNLPGGCTGSDKNPYYHQPGDTLANINAQTAFDIHRAALAAFFALATPPGSLYYQYIPLLKN